MPAAPCSAASTASSAIEDPLDDDGHRHDDDEPLQVGPVERRIEQVERLAGRVRVERARTAGSEPSSNVQWIRRSRSRAPTTGRSTVRKTARETRRDRLRDQLVGDAVVAEDVDLEEADAVGRGGRDLGRARGRERREAERRAGGCGGAREALLPVRMGHALVGDRRDDDRRRTALTEHRRRGRDGLDPAQHALAQAPGREGGDVLRERPLRPRPAGQVLGPVGIHAGHGQGLDVGERQRCLHRAIISLTSRPGAP